MSKKMTFLLAILQIVAAVLASIVFVRCVSHDGSTTLMMISLAVAAVGFATAGHNLLNYKKKQTKKS